jgi:hypothetical protein
MDETSTVSAMLRLLLAFAERISTEVVKGMEGGQR